MQKKKNEKQTWKLKFQAVRSLLYIEFSESFTKSVLMGKLRSNRSYTTNMWNTKKEIQQKNRKRRTELGNI
jgi:hypothetical protein